MVVFRDQNGSTWHAVGGGSTVADAIEFARASTPSEYAQLVSLRELYGD